MTDSEKTKREKEEKKWYFENRKETIRQVGLAKKYDARPMCQALYVHKILLEKTYNDDCNTTKLKRTGNLL